MLKYFNRPLKRFPVSTERPGTGFGQYNKPVSHLRRKYLQHEINTAEGTHKGMNRRITSIQGGYSANRTCCLGAHLADILNVGGNGLNDFTKGADAFAELMGANRAQAILLLRKAGAPHCPFGGSAPHYGKLKWRVPIEVVWRNLMLIDQLPETQGCNLAYEILSYASLEWIDLENAQLQGAILDHAYLGAARLTNADLQDANLDKANLSRADLRYVGARRTMFRTANLMAADLSFADVTAANFEGAQLHGTNFQDAVGRIPSRKLS